MLTLPPLPRPRLWLVGAWAVGAWGVPLATHALRLDWLLPVAILTLTAALLRGGRGLLDRLMIALLLLLTTTTVAGLLFTIWPWGLHPTPIAGLALTVLGTIHILGHRRLTLPKPTWGDGLITIAALGVTGYFLRPFLTTDTTGRLALLMVGEDSSRHFGELDDITRVGGYLFWQPASAAPNGDAVMRVYPQGWHLTAALLDSFARSSSALPDVSVMVEHYVALTIATYGLLTLTIIWAARWIAGPLLTDWHLLPLVTLLAGLLTFGEFPAMLAYGFIAEIFGLTLIAGLLAVLIRGPGDRREQLLMIALGVAGVGLSYQFFLPPVLLAVAAWLVTQRRHPRGQPGWPWWLGGLAAATGVALITVVLGFQHGGDAGAATADGDILASSKTQLAALAAIIIAISLTPAGRRLRVWRRYLLTVAAMACLPLGVRDYLYLKQVDAQYSFEKGLTLLSLALLLGLGGLALLIPRPRAAPRPAAARAATPRPWASVAARLGHIAPPVLIAVAVAASLGLAGPDTPYQGARTRAGVDVSRYLSHDAVPDNDARASLVTAIARRASTEPDVVTLVLGPNAREAYAETTYVAMLRRSLGLTDLTLQNGARWHTPEAIGSALMTTGDRLEFIALDDDSAAFAASVRAAYPDLIVGIITMPGEAT